MQHANSAKAKIVFKILSDILREERKKQNKSMRMLADEFDIQHSMISRLENAKNEAKLISIMTICAALGIKTSTVITRLEERLPKDFTLIDL